MQRILWSVWGAGLLGLAACMDSAMPEPSDGRALYGDYCAGCHGAAGRGDGPLAAGMTPPPADLTLIAARNGGELPRAQVLSTIDGYSRVHPDGPGMPEFGALLQGDLVPYDSGDGTLTPTPRRLVALLEYLETLQVEG
ncbi:cytochrome c [Salipiger manganoxidans]|nr:cytochrome c [Salipiger manganoxidans]